MALREVFGDMWVFAHEYDALCILTNMMVDRHGNNIMGRGSAGEAAKLFPHLPSTYGTMLLRSRRSNPNEPVVGVLRNKTQNWPALVAFPTKNDWRDKSDPVLIASSCIKLHKLILDQHWKSVLLPRPGCGKHTGQLDWERDVKPIIERSLPHQIVTIVDYGRPSPF